MKKLLILVMLLNPHTILGVEVLKKDQPAPYDGLLFSQEEEQRLRLKKEQDEARIDKLQKLGKIDAEIIGKQEKVITKLEKKENNSVLWFILGMVFTGASIYVGKKVSK